MSKFAILNTISRTAHRVGFQLKKHSPELLAAAGTVGVVASVVLACKATVKAKEILADDREQVEKIHNILADETVSEETYSEEDAKKDIAVIHTRTGVQIIKQYAPAVALGVLSLGTILTSNNILRKRNVALAAAYTAVDKGFKEYRGRVVERFGEELDRELRFNIKAREIERTVVNENGEEETVKEIVNVAEPNMRSEYTKCFDCGNTGWEKDAEYNLMYLRHQESYFNDLLRSRGHVFLNEVYDALGIPRTKAGNIVGWVYDESGKHGGDNYISFGIYNIHDENSTRFVNGLERSIWLDFNVDGPILNLI